MAEVLVVGMVVLGCFEIWLLVGYRDEEEPPLLFKESQPHFRRFWVEFSMASFAVSIR